MLDSASPKPRMKGLRGWLGEVQQNPHLDTIRSIVEADRASMATPSPAEARQIATSPGTSPLAQATTSPTEVGAPPPTPTTPSPAAVEPSLARSQQGEEAMMVGTTEDQPPVTAAATGPPPAISGPTGAPPLAVLGQATPAQTAAAVGRQPRQIFQTPEGQIRLSKKAAAQGDVEGEVEGLVTSGVPRDQAVEIVKQRMIRRGGIGATGYQSVAGQVTDAEGKVQLVNAAFDRARGQYIGTDPDSEYYGIPVPGFVSRASVGSQPRSYGMDREAIAKGKYGKQFKELTQEEASDVIQEEKKVIEGKAKSRGAGAGQAAFEKPIGVSEAQRTNTAVGASSANYAGQEMPSEAEQARRRGVENVQTELQHVKTLLAPLPKQGELAGLAPGAALAIRRRSPQYRTQIAQLESALDNMVNVLARTVGEQRGAQTEQDATRAYNTVVSMKANLLDPLKGDTQESAAARIAETEQYLATVLQSLPGNPVRTPVGAPPPAASSVKPPIAAKPGTKPAGAPSPKAYKDEHGNWRIQTTGRESQF